MVMNERVLVIGGTRGTGLLIVHRLRHRGFQVRALARDPARAALALGSSVEVVAGDITKPETLPPAVQGATHIIFTAGIRSGRFAREPLVELTEFQGVLHTLAAARDAGFRGRFVYLNSIGVTTPSWAGTLLNRIKRNVLVWRCRVEDEIRASGLDYTIIRVGFLVNDPGERRAVQVSQTALPLLPRHRIARADVADAFAEAMRHPRASRTTFDLVWGNGHREEWDALFSRLKPDR